MSMGKRGPMRVVTTPVTTNPTCSKTNAIEEMVGESDRNAIDLILGSTLSHACQDASHVDKTADNTRHRIIGMDLVLQIDEASVIRRDERFEHLPHRHDAVSHCNLTLLALEIREVLHVHVE